MRVPNLHTGQSMSALYDGGVNRFISASIFHSAFHPKTSMLIPPVFIKRGGYAFEPVGFREALGVFE
jgi:hypothetical protein